MSSPPRYSDVPLPAYGYRPGRTPHPRRDPAGHSHDRTEPAVGGWDPCTWRTLDAWLAAVDLFNRGYWWEAHEWLEALWKAAGRKGREASFVQGVLQVAAAFLGRECGREGAAALAERGLAAIDTGAGDRARFMGMAPGAFAAAVRRSFETSGPAPSIDLEFTEGNA